MSIIRKLLLIVIAAVALQLPAIAQETKVTDTNYSACQEWLSKSWLKNNLAIEGIENNGDQLQLNIRLNGPGNFAKRWSALESAYQKTSKIVFEDYLLEKVGFLLELPKTKLLLVIKNKTGLYEKPCFSRTIGFRDSVIIQKVNCKDVSGRAELDYADFKPSFCMKKFTVVTNSDGKMKEILQSLYMKSTQCFLHKNPNAEIYIITRSLNSITFMVQNLNNEVIERKLTRPATSEKLQFSIICSLTSKSAVFNINLNGKFEAKNFSNGIHDMDNDYKPELQDYLEKFTNNNFLKWLRN